jgi:hypothetical protein
MDGRFGDFEPLMSLNVMNALNTRTDDEIVFSEIIRISASAVRGS